jgi:hypothetical protein
MSQALQISGDSVVDFSAFVLRVPVKTVIGACRNTSLKDLMESAVVKTSVNRIVSELQKVVKGRFLIDWTNRARCDSAGTEIHRR